MASDFNEDEFISGLGNYIVPPASMAPPLPEKSGAFRRVVGDTGVSALRGAIGLSEIPVGLADIPTGGAVGKGLEYLGYRPKEAKAALSELYSPEQQAINRGMSETKGFLPTAAYMAANPSTIYHGVVESAPSMIGGAGIARGAMKLAPKLSGVAAGAIGEGTAMAGSSAERMRQESETGYLTPETTLAALGTGLGGAAVGALGGKFAGSRGVADVETSMARGALPTKTDKGFFRRIGEGAGIEGAEEFAQSSHETIMENLATGRPAFEGVPEAAAQGMMTGGVMGAGTNVVAGRAPKDLLKPKETPAPSAPVAPVPPTMGQGEMFPTQAGPVQPTHDELMADAEQQVWNERQRDLDLLPAAQDVVSRPYAEDDTGGPTGAGTAAEAAETAARFRAAQDMKSAAEGFVPGQVVAPERPAPEQFADTARTAIPATHPSLQAGKAAFVEAGGSNRAWDKLIGQHSADGLVSDIELQKTLGKKTRDQATAERNTAALTAMMGVTPEVATTETSQADALAGQLVDQIAALSKTQRTRSGIAKIKAAARERSAPLVAKMKTEFVRMGGKAHVWSKLEKDSGGDFTKLHKALTAMAVSPKQSPNKVGAVVALKARVDEPGTTSTAFPKVKIKRVKGAKNAVKEIPVKASVPAKPEGRIKGRKAPEASTGDSVRREAPVGQEEVAIAKKAVAKEDPETLWNEEFRDPESKRDMEFKDLSDDLQDRWSAAVEDGIASNREFVRIRDTQRENEAIDRRAAAPRASVSGETTGQTAAELKARLSNAFASPHFMNRTVVIHENDAALPEQFASMRSTDGGKTQGFYDPKTKKVHLIANNIDPGVELSVVLHEVGVHMGMKNLLGEKNYGKLIGQVKEWVNTGGDAMEYGLAERAMRRVKVAQANFGEMSDAVADEELLAYFVEEAVNAGIDPTAISSQPKALQDWFRLLWASIKSAVQKLGINPATLTAFDVVNLAYGAAQLELDTEIRSGDMSEGRAMQSVAGILKGSSRDMADAAKSQSKFALNSALDKVMFTEDLVKRAVARGLETAGDFGRMMNEKTQTRNKYEQQVAKIASEAANLPDREAASSFIRESTLSQKWAYQPAWLKEPVAIDKDLKKTFEEVLSAEAQKVVKDVFEFGHETREQMQRDVNKEIEDEYDLLAEHATTPDEKIKVADARKAKIASVGRYVAELAGPYAPLKRFGDHVVVAKSKEFLEAEKNEDKAALAKLETDPKHYRVEQHEYKYQADARAKELAEEFPEGFTDTWVKQDSHRHVTELPWSGIEKIKNTIEGLPEDTKNRESMRALVTNLYLELLSDTSARKSELRRKGVTGSEDDMFRSFASQGRATANYLSALQHNGEINKSIAAMQKDAKAPGGSRGDKTAVLNELTSRYAQSLEYKDTPAVDAAMKFTSFWLLLTSPAYYIQNALQPFMLTLPVLAGRFGYSTSAAAGTQAYKDVFSYIRKTPVHQLDIDKLNIDPKEKDMLRALQAEGLLDMTITQDLGRFTEGEGALSKGPVGAALRKIWAGPQHVELLNRVASALAAYRLSSTDKKFSTELARTNYAKEIISGTHGNYSSFNAPRFFTSTGAMRLITQFRKYQLIQLTLLAKTWRDAFQGATPEEKAIARRAGLWLLGQHGLMTGAMGLPIPALIWAIAAAIGSDDDEEKDPEQMIRDMIGHEGLSDLLLRGVPAALGLSLSQKVGMGNAFSALPFADMPKDKAGYEKALIASLGATAGVGGTIFDAMGKMSDGKYYKGVETAMPVGLKNAMKGFRMATEGVTSNAGDVLLKPEDVSFVDGLAQGVGLPTMTISERQRRQGVVIEMDKFYKERTADMKRAYMAAFESKDAEDMASVRESWVSLQKARQANGYARQPFSVLTRTPREQRKRERMVSGGVEFNKQSRRFVEGLTE